jgi:hypothetical protein
MRYRLSGLRNGKPLQLRLRVLFFILELSSEAIAPRLEVGFRNGLLSEDLIRVRVRVAGFRIGLVFKFVQLGFSSSWAQLTKTFDLDEERFIEQIDNSNLLAPDGYSISSTCQEGVDLFFVSAEGWQVLQSWYFGGPVISRNIALVDSELKVEINPPLLTVKLRELGVNYDFPTIKSTSFPLLTI